MTSNILKDYNRQIEEREEICYKNNRGNKHDYESINSQQVSNNVVEVEYICLQCGNMKYVYNYIEDSEIEFNNNKKGKRKMKVSHFTTLFIQPFKEDDDYSF